MNDLRVGRFYSYPVGRLVPLESRGPSWALFPLGATLSAAATVGGPGLLLRAFGAALSPLAIGVGAAFLFFCLSIALIVCPPARRTGSNLFAAVFGVGHSFLLIGFGAAHFVPGASSFASSILRGIPLMPADLLLGSGLGPLAPLFLLAFVGFSVLAPIATLLFRYVALRRDESWRQIRP